MASEMMKGGKGGANTRTGLVFETRVDLKETFKGISGYSVFGDDLFFDGTRVATFYKKHDFHNKFLRSKDVNSRAMLSKLLLPDNALLVLATKTMFIIEVKFQHGSGSVDEKLQTCDFKIKQYRKLLSPLGVRVKFAYVLIVSPFNLGTFI